MTTAEKISVVPTTRSRSEEPRLNSSHVEISYAVFCLKKKKTAFSPDGEMITTGGGDGTSRVWDLTTYQLTSLLRGHTDGITAVSFAPDGRSQIYARSQRTVMPS